MGCWFSRPSYVLYTSVPTRGKTERRKRNKKKYHPYKAPPPPSDVVVIPMVPVVVPSLPPPPDVVVTPMVPVVVPSLSPPTETKEEEKEKQKIRDNEDPETGELFAPDWSVVGRAEPVPMRVDDSFAYSLRGPSALAYAEVVEIETGIRRHIWSMGEFHAVDPDEDKKENVSCDDTPGNVPVADWLTHVIRSNKSLGCIFDFFIESSFVSRGKHWARRELNTHGLQSIEDRFLDCLRRRKHACEFKNNSRFHYVDTRDIGRLEALAYILHHTEVVQRNGFRKEVIEPLATSNSDNYQPDVVMSLCRQGPSAFMQRNTDNFLAEGRVSHEYTHHEQINGKMSRISGHINDFFDKERARYMAIIRERERRDWLDLEATPTHELTNAIRYWCTTIMDEYTFLRLFGRFPGEQRPDWITPRNCFLYTGMYHHNVYIRLIRYLVEKGSLAMNVEYNWSATSDEHPTRCTFFPRDLFRVMAPTAVDGGPQQAVRQVSPWFPFRKEGTIQGVDAMALVCVTLYRHIRMLVDTEEEDEKSNEASDDDNRWSYVPIRTHTLWFVQPTKGYGIDTLTPMGPQVHVRPGVISTEEDEFETHVPQRFLRPGIFVVPDIVQALQTLLHLFHQAQDAGNEVEDDVYHMSIRRMLVSYSGATPITVRNLASLRRELAVVADDADASHTRRLPLTRGLFI